MHSNLRSTLLTRNNPKDELSDCSWDTQRDYLSKCHFICMCTMVLGWQSQRGDWYRKYRSRTRYFNISETQGSQCYSVIENKYISLRICIKVCVEWSWLHPDHLVELEMSWHGKYTAHSSSKLKAGWTMEHIHVRFRRRQFARVFKILLKRK